MKKKIQSKVGKIANKEKAKKAIKNTGSFIEKNQKPLLYVGAALLVGYLGYKVYRGIKKGSEIIGDVLENPEDDFIKPKIKITTSNLTITPQQASIFSKSLQDAFNKKSVIGLPATDEQKISNVFDKLKTGDDFKLVYEAFGYKKYFSGGTPTLYIDKKIASTYDLVYWLDQEIDSFWDKELHAKVKKRLQSAGFDF
ncbi:hypothetical protein [Tenacibaculum sp. 190524A02b]|uniref:hypothetical protein n=1 Tax=Tenacibaculum vairaonense TaxID=3137860 RepID=UPI0031FAC37C